MEPRLPITPLPSGHGRHAGLVSLGLLAATTAVVGLTRQTGPSTVDPRPPPAAVSQVTTRPPIELGPETVTVAVAEREIPRILTATGMVTFDESRTHHVRSPVAGVFVRTRPSSLGRAVRAGEVIGVVYSLEVAAATATLIAELREFRGQEHVDRERMRLLRWSMRREQIARIEDSMTPTAALPLIARKSGKVTFEDGPQRQLIDTDVGDLATITDPTRAAIYVDVPEADADLLQVGRTTRVSLGKTSVSAPIGFVSQYADDGVKVVRIDLHPVPLKTPPATWKDVEAKIELARVVERGLAVPTTAVARNNQRTFVYVVRGDHAEPLDVRLGADANGYILVKSGLATGDWVLNQAPTL